MPFKVVYGSYKSQPGFSADVAITNIGLSTGYALGHVKDKECRALELCDVITFTPLQRGKALDIPFAALIRTHIDMPSGDTQAVTAFLRYATQMTPATNILNRPGLFAIKAQERRIRVPVTHENWRGFVDEARVDRAARNAI